MTTVAKLVTIMLVATLHSQGVDASFFGLEADPMRLFAQAYTTSPPFGFMPSVYFLSTYYVHYPQAIEACKALGGHLAEINSYSEFEFVTNFIQDNVESTPPQDFHISGFRRENTGRFRSALGVDMVALINSYADNTNPDTTGSSNNPLYFDFFPNRPRPVGNLPTCLTFEKTAAGIKMGNGRCQDDNKGSKYLCEKFL